MENQVEYWQRAVAYIGATISKKALGLKVATMDGQPINMGQALARNAIRS